MDRIWCYMDRTWCYMDRTWCYMDRTWCYMDRTWCYMDRTWCYMDRTWSYMDRTVHAQGPDYLHPYSPFNPSGAAALAGALRRCQPDSPPLPGAMSHSPVDANAIALMGPRGLSHMWPRVWNT
ncbi:unnamed protein product [Boreogadus saida]